MNARDDRKLKKAMRDVDALQDQKIEELRSELDSLKKKVKKIEKGLKDKDQGQDNKKTPNKVDPPGNHPPA